MTDNFKSVFDSLPAAIRDRANALVAAREANGTNVHFLREDGTRDRYSFATMEGAEKFKASLRRQGRTIIEGN